MLLPLRCLHHVFDTGTLRSTKESEQPLMLGNARFPVRLRRHPRFRVGGFGLWRALGFLAACTAVRGWTFRLAGGLSRNCRHGGGLRLVRGVVIDARTTQSPANCEASPRTEAAACAAGPVPHQCVLAGGSPVRFFECPAPAPRSGSCRYPAHALPRLPCHHHGTARAPSSPEPHRLVTKDRVSAHLLSAWPSFSTASIALILRKLDTAVTTAGKIRQ